MRRTIKTRRSGFHVVNTNTGTGKLRSFLCRRTAILRVSVLTMLLTLGFSLSTISQADTLSSYKPKPDPMPGGVAVIELPVSLGTEEEPVVYFQGRRTFVKNHPYNKKSDNRWITWVGIPLNTPSGKEPLLIEQPNGRNREIMINIRPPKHSERYLVSREPVQKNLSAAQQQQIINDANLIKRLTLQRSGLEPDVRPFLHPTRGEIIRPFGDQTYLNGKLLDSHNGIDLSGQRANAPADGKIVLIKDLFYGGKTVLIDHGRGLFTQYSHLASVNVRVREGQRIRRGEEIGKVGRSGHRIDIGKDYAADIKQPHLHWSVSLNGVFVDPKLFLMEAE